MKGVSILFLYFVRVFFSKRLDDEIVSIPVRHVTSDGNFSEKNFQLKRSDANNSHKLFQVCLDMCRKIHIDESPNQVWMSSCTDAMVPYVTETLQKIDDNSVIVHNDSPESSYDSAGTVPLESLETSEDDMPHIVDDRIVQITSADGESVMNIPIGRATEEGFQIFWAGMRTSGLKIGRFCNIAHTVTFFLDGQHCYTHISMFPLAYFFRNHSRGLVPDLKKQCAEMSVRPIFIGNDVTIEDNVTVMFGVHIGDGAVVRAGSVVRRNVSAYSVVTGNPAVLQYVRFEEHHVQALLSARWWDWTLKEVRRAVPLLLDPDPSFLLRRAEQLGKMTPDSHTA